MRRILPYLHLQVFSRVGILHFGLCVLAFHRQDSPTSSPTHLLSTHLFVARLCSLQIAVPPIMPFTEDKAIHAEFHLLNLEPVRFSSIMLCNTVTLRSPRSKSSSQPERSLPEHFSNQFLPLNPNIHASQWSGIHRDAFQAFHCRRSPSGAHQRSSWSHSQLHSQQRAHFMAVPLR